MLAPKRISLAELERQAGEAIRMLGLPVGHADDVSPVFVWTEVVLKRGVACLRIAGQDQDKNQPLSISKISELKNLEINLEGKPLIFFAERIVDYIVSRNVGLDWQEIYALDTIGGWAAPYIAYRLAERGLTAVVKWIPDNDVCDLEAPELLIIATSGSPNLIVNAVPCLDLQDVSVLDFTPHEVSNLRPSDQVASHSVPSSAVIAVTCAKISSQIELAKETAGGRAQLHVVPVASNIQAALNDGLIISAEDWALLGSLVRKRWLPSSERSRNQAG